MKRCTWATSPLMQAYHDQEWGVPVHDDDRLFEFLTLEGAQAGLSWDTVLRKRDRYRELFAGFEIAKVARFTPARVERILTDPGIVRNRAKVESTVSNAKAALRVRREFGSLDAFLWSFTGGKTMRKARPKSASAVPAFTPESSAMSEALRDRGFRFVGPTICYALMQAVGMVDDHIAGCSVARRSR
ncbi:MAG: DNA-3-methyladenine glycosylase I [Vulcanimicrobiaceae bacterium]